MVAVRSIRIGVCVGAFAAIAVACVWIWLNHAPFAPSIIQWQTDEQWLVFAQMEPEPEPTPTTTWPNPSGA